MSTIGKLLSILLTILLGAVISTAIVVFGWSVLGLRGNSALALAFLAALVAVVPTAIRLENLDR